MNYKIGKIDKDYQTVKTEFKEASNRKIKTYQISINVRVKNSVAVITSVTRDETGILVSKDTELEISYRPSKLTMHKELFGEMDAYAKKLSSTVEYEQR